MSEVITDWVHHHSVRLPDAIALRQVETGEALTWHQLERRVAALAGALCGMGIGTGDRVAVLADNDVRMLELQFACIRIGACFVPLNWRLTATELSVHITDAAPSLIVHDRAWSHLVDELQRLHTIKHRLAWGNVELVQSYEDTLRDGPAVGGGLLDPTALAQILYTSGTTGRPKGVLITNRMMVTHAHNIAHSSRVAEAGCHHLNIVPWFHAGGLNVFTNPILYWGGQVTTVRRFDTKQTLSLLADAKMGITHLCGVLQMYEWMVADEQFREISFPTLHTVLFGGWGPATRKVYRAFRDRGIRLQLGYGATELGPLVTVLSGQNDTAAENGSSGMVLPLTQIRLTGSDGSDVMRGETGELTVRGQAVTPGYWGLESDDVLDGQWFRTGDVGRMDEHGHLYIVGRLKEMYRSGGENIYPTEVEDALVGIAGVRDLAVVGVYDERWGEAGLLAVVLEKGVTLTLADVHHYAEGRLARFKYPAHLMVVDALPRSATDKVARPALRKLFEAAGTGGGSEARQ